MCVYPIIALVSWFVYFWCSVPVRISLAGRVIYFPCVIPLCGVSAGTIYERDSLDWMAGLYGFFFLSGYVVADTVRLKWWGGGPFFFFL